MAEVNLGLTLAGTTSGQCGYGQGSPRSFFLQDCGLGQEQHDCPWAPRGGTGFGEVKKEPLGPPGLLLLCERASVTSMSVSPGPFFPLNGKAITVSYMSQGSWSTALAFQPEKQPDAHLVMTPPLPTSGALLGSASQPAQPHVPRSPR